MIQVTAPAKIILLGEHAVVYGQPAIAIPVLRLRAVATAHKAVPGSGLQIVASDLGSSLKIATGTGEALSDNPIHVIASKALNVLGIEPPDLTITVQSDIPVASGLGSGAAISTVIARALALALETTFDNSVINDLVYEVEKFHHGTPSGIDNTVIVYERPVYFVPGRDIDFFSVKGSFHFLIADTGVGALTRVAVGDVKKLYQQRPEHYQPIFEAIGNLVAKAQAALETGDYLQLGSLINQNHAYLQELTVSSLELDRLVEAARKAGAFGAKLSGGGRGGNMIALVAKELLPIVRSALLDAGAVRVFETVLE